MVSSQREAKKVIVIGGGISGLATAALLGKSGYQVTVLEKNTTLGGRARTLKLKGFSFDMGPSWYLMPEVFERFFAEFGKQVSDFYQLQRLNPKYQVFFGDNIPILFKDNLESTVSWFESQESGAGLKLRQYLHKLQAIYEVTVDRLLYQDLGSNAFFANLNNLKALKILFKNTSFWKSWHQEVSSYFSSPKLQQVLSFGAVFLGGSPFTTPALFSILNWADINGGVWYPKGGFKQLISALEKLCREYGVTIITEADVTHITVSKAHVTGVKTKDTKYTADMVIGAGDLASLETQLLPEKYQERDETDWQQKKLGISAVLIYLGLNTRLTKVQHHSLYFSKAWKQNFSDILDHKIIPSDPSFYVSLRSATDRSIVPPKSDELFILVPLGSRTTYPAKELEAVAERVISKVEALFGQPIRPQIVAKKIYTPQDFAQDYGAYQGTALGLAHTWNQSLWGRPDYRSPRVANLYYVGQYTNPGVGVPMALVSAQNVVELIKKKHAPDKNRIFRNGSTTYYYSSLFFTGQTKQEVFTLYAYVRLIDDLVDTLEPQLSEIEFLWQQTLAAWHGKPVSNTVVADFVALAKRKKFKWDWVEAFWKAMRADLAKTHYNSMSQLQDYMYGSAEVIGLMMAHILELPPKAAAAAKMQGRAMQYINFIRDVAEDEALGRNYLGYTAATKADPKAWNAQVQTYLEQYQKWQHQAEAGYIYIPKRYLVPIKTAAQMYQWTAHKIQHDSQRVWRQKIKPSKVRVVLQLLRNVIDL